MSRLKKLGIRFASPLSFLDSAAEMWLRIVRQRVDSAACLRNSRLYATDTCHQMYVKNESESNSYICEHNNKEVYVRNKEGMRYIVNFEEKKCSCGQWQQQRLICSHGIAAAFHAKHNKT